MNRNILLLLVLFLLTFNNVNANNNIVFLDMQKILTISKPGANLVKQLKVINDNNIASFKKDEIKLIEREKKIIAKKNIIAGEIFNQEFNKLQSDVEIYNKEKKVKLENFNKLKNDNLNRLIKQINSILLKYSDENSIDLILSKKNIIIGRSNIDVTNKIIETVNKEIKNFNIK
jgi:Skp family chaperone for outer membrane proteins